MAIPAIIAGASTKTLKRKLSAAPQRTLAISSTAALPSTRGCGAARGVAGSLQVDEPIVKRYGDGVNAVRSAELATSGPGVLIDRSLGDVQDRADR